MTVDQFARQTLTSRQYGIFIKAVHKFKDMYFCTPEQNLSSEASYFSICGLLPADGLNKQEFAVDVKLCKAWEAASK